MKQYPQLVTENSSPQPRHDFFVRNLHPGMGQAIAERTVLRKRDGVWENWGDVAIRVARGNVLLDKRQGEEEFSNLRNHIAAGRILMSGRHLQHGDETQPTRNMEVFTNCATSASSFVLFYLLLNGSGVGRCYDDDMMLVNWDNAPNLRCVLSDKHPDFDFSAHESARAAKHKYTGKDVLWFEVPDSREGWTKAVEIFENAAFEKIHKDKLLVLDFSKVRPKGSPIGGMQNRPSSGPVPLMNALLKAASVKGSGMPLWKQALYVDHYLAECVLVGGARRAARMSTKSWKDGFDSKPGMGRRAEDGGGIFEFIEVKRPIEYDGMTMDEVVQYKKDLIAEGEPQPTSFLWSSNNSVAVDADFWRYVNMTDYGLRQLDKNERKLARHAKKVFDRLTECSFGDGTGEPGIINVDTLVQKDEGWSDLSQGDYVESPKYQVEDDTLVLMKRLSKRAKAKKYHMIVNPCSEIVLSLLGGFCVIADVVPYHADTLDDAEDSFIAATRALIRVNTMKSIYQKEVTRTNRIGVGMTGVHEFAWKFFRVGFKDLVTPDFAGYVGEESMDSENPKIRAAAFWRFLSRVNSRVQEEAKRYSEELGLNVPHTMFTIKPAGTTSKLFGLTEGWHLPAMAWYLRWVQFRTDDPLVEQYRDEGYPTRELRDYEGTTIIGFPTEPTIATLGMGDELVLAGEAAPEQQYQWLRLGEMFWLEGRESMDDELPEENYANQISYTLKYKHDRVNLEEFRKILMERQSAIKCCSVMPQEDDGAAAYEYLPEEPISKVRYEEVARSIQKALAEDIGKEHVDCDSGACPIDFNAGTK